MDIKQVKKIKKGDTLIIDGKDYYVYTEPLTDMFWLELSTNSQMDKHTIIHVSYFDETYRLKSIMNPPQLFVLQIYDYDPSKIYMHHIDYVEKHSEVSIANIKLK